MQRWPLPREIRQPGHLLFELPRLDSSQPLRQDSSRLLRRDLSRPLPPDLSRLLPREPPQRERLRPETFVAQRELAQAN
jgi:hypothetical protein